jgi:hypothetical protein
MSKQSYEKKRDDQGNRHDEENDCENHPWEKR